MKIRSIHLLLSAYLLTMTSCLHAMATFSAHIPITEEAAKYGMWSPSALQLLTAAVVYPDREFNTNAGGKQYIPAIHFDRFKSQTIEQAFSNGITLYHKNLKAASAYASKGDFTGALVYLGSAVHAAEDFISHSNYIELPAKQQKVIERIFFEGESMKKMPRDLLVTQYDPDMPNPGMPIGSNYAHDIKSKDFPFLGDVAPKYFHDKNATGYELAYKAAVFFAKRTLNAFMRSVDYNTYLKITHLSLWNVFPPLPKNCHVGDVDTQIYGTSMDSAKNVVCKGTPKYLYPPLTD